jgi:hypothetical protein
MKSLLLLCALLLGLNAYALEDYELQNIADMYHDSFTYNDPTYLKLLNEKVEELGLVGKGHRKIDDLYKKSVNYLNIREGLRKCLEENGLTDERNLSGSLLAAARTRATKCITALYRPEDTNYEAIKGFTDQFPLTTQYMDYSLTEEKIYWQAMKNSMDAYGLLTTLTEEKDPKKWAWQTEKELRDRYCRRNKQKQQNNEPVMTDRPKIQMPDLYEDPQCIDLAKKIVEKYASRERVPYDQVLNHINKGVETINGKIMDIKDMGSITWESDRYSRYVSEYYKVASDGPGLLMHTKALRDRNKGGVGHVNSPTELYDYSTRYHTQLRPTVEDPDGTLSVPERYPIIGEAIEEAKEKVYKEIEELKDDHFDKKDDDQTVVQKNYATKAMEKRRFKSVKKMVKFSTMAAGQVLMENPETVDTYCQAIGQIEQDDKNRETRDKVIRIGGAIVGGALMVTGLGFGVGAAIIAGVALSAAELAYHGGSAYYDYQNYKKHERALLAGNAYDRTQIEQSMEQVKRSLVDAGISLGSLVLFEVKYLKVLKGANPNTIGKYSKMLVDNTKTFKKELGEQGLKRLALKDPKTKMKLMKRLWTKPTRMMTKKFMGQEKVLTFVPSTVLSFFMFDAAIDAKKKYLDDPTDAKMEMQQQIQDEYIARIQSDFELKSIYYAWTEGRMDINQAVNAAYEKDLDKQAYYQALMSSGGELSAQEYIDQPSNKNIQKQMSMFVDNREATLEKVLNGQLEGWKMDEALPQSHEKTVSDIAAIYRDLEVKKEIVTMMISRPTEFESVASQVPEYKAMADKIMQADYFKHMVEIGLDQDQLLYEVHQYIQSDAHYEAFDVFGFYRLKEDGSLKTRQDLWDYHKEEMAEKYTN